MARYLKSSDQILTETYIGSPPYSYIRGVMPSILRQYHAAEHKVYNCFMRKIRKLPNDAPLSKLAEQIPSLHEVRNSSSHSIFCGSTLCVSSAILLLGAATPNLFRFQNHNLAFMSLCLGASLALAYCIGSWLQQRYYVAKPNDKQR